MEIEQIECLDCRGTGKCSRCKGTGLMDCNCRSFALELIYSVYGHDPRYYSKDRLGYFICKKCNRLWLIRVQIDPGAGNSYFRLRPGAKDGRFEFKPDIAYHIRGILGAKSPGELPEGLVHPEPWLQDLAKKKLEELQDAIP